MPKINQNLSVEESAEKNTIVKKIMDMALNFSIFHRKLLYKFVNNEKIVDYCKLKEISDVSYFMLQEVDLVADCHFEASSMPGFLNMVAQQFGLSDAQLEGLTCIGDICDKIYEKQQRAIAA